MPGTVHFPSVDSAEVLRSIRDDDSHLIDVRPIDAYNGWRLSGESRGGHIATARSLPLKWFSYIDLPDIIDAKGLDPARNLIIYGYEEGDVIRAARSLKRLGYPRISHYPDFLSLWTKDDGLPLERMQRYESAVPAEWLKRLQDREHADPVGKDGFVVCHCHYRNPEDYALGHVPGAVELDTNALESTETWNRRSPAELLDALTSKGITADTTVIVYGRFSNPRNDDPFPGSSEGQLGAMRCAFIMLYAGVKDVRVLNGGLQSWKDSGFEESLDPVEPRAVDGFGDIIPARPHLAVDIPEAKDILASEDANLVCVRSWPELIGKVSGYHYIDRKGRIPGAVFGNCGSDAYHMENYRNLDHTGREYHEIEKMWAEVGVTPDKRNAFYCGTGWRGSEAFFNAWLMGWPRIAVFDGGWFEWSRDPSNPCETGEPEGMRVSGRIYGL